MEMKMKISSEIKRTTSSFKMFQNVFFKKKKKKKKTSDGRPDYEKLVKNEVKKKILWRKCKEQM